MVRHYENVYDKPEKGVKKNVFSWGKKLQQNRKTNKLGIYSKENIY